MGSDWTQTGSLGAAEADVTISQGGAGTVTFQLSGTFSATVTFEATNETGANPTWVAVPAANVNTGATATTTTAAGIYRILASAYLRVRARCSAYTSGTINVVAVASLGNTASGGTVTLTGTSVVDTELPAAATLADAAANPTAPAVAAHALGFNGTTWDRLRVASASVPDLRVAIAGVGGAADASTNAMGLATDQAGAARPMGVAPLLWSGTAWERTRPNIDATLLASAARTTTQTGSDITAYNARGIHVVLDMTVVGTGSVTLTIEGKDSVSGKYYTLLAGAAVTTNSTNVYKIYPGLTAAANAAANDHLPRTFRINVTANNANSASYSVGYSLLV